MEDPGKHRWALLQEAPNKLEALFIQGRLQALGIPAYVQAETAAELYGIVHGALAQARIYVPQERLEEAKSALAEDAPS